LCSIAERFHALGRDPLLVGIDASAVQLEYMAQVVAKRGCSNVMSIHANAEHLPFTDGAFDAIVCSEVLEHIRAPQIALAEMHRVLKPGGKLLLSTPSKLNEDLWDIVLTPAVWLGRKVLRRRPTVLEGREEAFDLPWYPAELRRALAGAGFDVAKFEQTGLIPHPHYFQYVPRKLLAPMIGAFEVLDARLGHVLPAFAAHLLVAAEAPRTGAPSRVG
jgi:SAM-dependent methyltransferase